jgi:hypothetical protein
MGLNPDHFWQIIGPGCPGDKFPTFPSDREEKISSIYDLKRLSGISKFEQINGIL